MEAKGSLITINFDGKPLEKLIDVVSQGIGTIYRPRKIRNEADAQAYAIKRIEDAKTLALADSRIVEAETSKRIQERINAKEVRRQNNIDSVVEQTASLLVGADVSDKPVDQDWSIRFFDIVQDISREEMKTLWAKILSKEIERPSSFSLRTLELLRNISYDEASLFMKICDFVLGEGNCFLFNEDGVLEKHGFRYVDIARLTEIGLLQSGTFVIKSYESNPTEMTKTPVIYGNNVFILSIPPATKKIDIPVVLLSQPGCEIYGLIDSKSNKDYIHEFASYCKKENKNVKVQYGKLLEIKDGMVRFETPLTDL